MICIGAKTLIKKELAIKSEMQLFKNRIHAGKLLAFQLKSYKKSDAIVLAIPRGGIPVAYAVAQKLNLPLDIILTKKIGHPDNKEFAIGWVSLNSYYVNLAYDVTKEYVKNEVKRIRKLMNEKYKLYMGNKEPLSITNKTIILIDDGIATGYTMLAAIKTLREKKVHQIIVAVPVAPKDDSLGLKNISDDFISLMTPEQFLSVGSFYDDFGEVSDEEVVQILNY